MLETLQDALLVVPVAEVKSALVERVVLLELHGEHLLADRIHVGWLVEFFVKRERKAERERNGLLDGETSDERAMRRMRDMFRSFRVYTVARTWNVLVQMERSKRHRALGGSESRHKVPY